MGYNAGGVTSSSIARQFRNEFVTKAVIQEAKKKRIFSQLSDKLTQPKNFGTKLVMRRDYPIFHHMNRMDGGIDASKATLMSQVFYAYNGAIGETDGILAGQLGGGNAPDGGFFADGTTYADSAAALAAATAACTNGGIPKSSSGLLYGGSASHSVVVGNLPTIGEYGGAVNEVNARSVLVEASIQKFGLASTYSLDEANLGSIQGLIAKKIRDLGEARAEMGELLVMNDLMVAASANTIYASNSATTVDNASVGPKDVLTYDVLRQLATDLKKARTPKDTKVITGSTKIGTKVVGKAYYMYVPTELYDTLEDIKDSDGNRKWEPYESYMDAKGSNIAEGEIGRIGQFRFIEVEDMLRYAGEGWVTTDKDEGGDAATGDAGIANVYETNGKTDVFSLMVVGSDSFTTIGFTGDTTRAVHTAPKADAHNDYYGEKGVIAIKWWHGTLIKRPERIREVRCAVVL